MATQTCNKYKELLMKKVIDFPNDSFKIILMKKGFLFSRAAHSVYADVLAEEIAGVYGYTTGGQGLTGISVVKDDVNNVAYATWNNPSWIAATGNLECDGAIIYDDTITSPVIDPIIGYIDFGGTIVTIDGGTFTISALTVVTA